MSIIRVGSTSSYAEGWEAIFGSASGSGGKGRAKPAAKKASKKPAPAAAAKRGKKPVAKKRRG